ncbi:MAG: hypothetical protein AB8H79_05145 [Myxococcota bacterium]
MKSRAQTPQQQTKAPTSSGPAQAAADMGNAAAEEGLETMGVSETPTLDALGLPDVPDNPASAAASALGLDGLQVDGDSLSFKGAGLSFDEQLDVTLGAIGPLTVGLNGKLAANFGYGFQGKMEDGWFGARYATVSGDANMDLDTSIQAKVALDLLVAEGGLRGGLTLKGGLRGTTTGVLSFGEDGVHIDSLSLHVEGEAVLGAAAELYLSSVLTEEETWELGALPLGIASGLSLDLSWTDAGFSGIDGSMGSGFTMSAELETLIADLREKAGV